MACFMEYCFMGIYTRSQMDNQCTCRSAGAMLTAKFALMGVLGDSEMLHRVINWGMYTRFLLWFVLYGHNVNGSIRFRPSDLYGTGATIVPVSMSRGGGSIVNPVGHYSCSWFAISIICCLLNFFFFFFNLYVFLSIGLDPLNIEAGIKVIHVPCEVFGCLWFWITLLPNDVSEYIMHIYNKTSNMRRTLVDNTFWSLRCSWSIACWCCSNYIFILDLTPCFNGLGKVNCQTRRETFKLCD